MCRIVKAFFILFLVNVSGFLLGAEDGGKNFLEAQIINLSSKLVLVKRDVLRYAASTRAASARAEADYAELEAFFYEFKGEDEKAQDARKRKAEAISEAKGEEVLADGGGAAAPSVAKNMRDMDWLQFMINDQIDVEFLEFSDHHQDVLCALNARFLVALEKEEIEFKLFCEAESEVEFLKKKIPEIKAQLREITRQESALSDNPDRKVGGKSKRS